MRILYAYYFSFTKFSFFNFMIIMEELILFYSFNVDGYMVFIIIEFIFFGWLSIKRRVVLVAKKILSRLILDFYLLFLILTYCWTYLVLWLTIEFSMRSLVVAKLLFEAF